MAICERMTDEQKNEQTNNQSYYRLTLRLIDQTIIFTNCLSKLLCIIYSKESKTLIQQLEQVW